MKKSKFTEEQIRTSAGRGLQPTSVGQIGVTGDYVMAKEQRIV